MIAVIFEWIKQNIFILYWLGGISLLLFIITAIAVPLFIIHLPSDFLLYKKRKQHFEQVHFTLRILIIIAKNFIGIILVAAGVLMLILPGQGIITILIGLVLIDFPGKNSLILFILSNPIVLNAINWIREKNRKKKLKLSGITGEKERKEDRI